MHVVMIHQALRCRAKNILRLTVCDKVAIDNKMNRKRSFFHILSLISGR